MNIQHLIEKAIEVYENSGKKALTEFIRSLPGDKKQELRKSLSARSLKQIVFKIVEFSHSIRMG